jgi:hypothetical protein
MNWNNLYIDKEQLRLTLRILSVVEPYNFQKEVRDFIKSNQWRKYL